MDILARLPNTHAGRHTKWLWSLMLAVAEGDGQIDLEEVARHFAPSVFAHVPAADLRANWTQLAPSMSLVTELIEETNSEHCYSALLRSNEGWLRFACLVQDNEPKLLVAAYWSLALDPNCYVDRRVQRAGRDVQIRDYGGAGPLMLLWHGAGCELTSWETIVPLLTGFHLIAQDLPGHGRSRSRVFTTADALADADAVIAEVDQGAPIVVGHSLGGYLSLRYAATRKCVGWIGLDGPLGLVYPWDVDDCGNSETILQISREINAFDVAAEFAAIDCPAMLMLCAVAANSLEKKIVQRRQELAEHLARHHSEVHVEWVQRAHDAILFDRSDEIAVHILDFLHRSHAIGRIPAEN